MRQLGSAIAWAATVIGCNYMARSNEGAAGVVGVMGAIVALMILSSKDK